MTFRATALSHKHPLAGELLLRRLAGIEASRGIELRRGRGQPAIIQPSKCLR